MKKLRRRFSRSKRRRSSVVKRDTAYVSVFERGLALDRTPNLGRRERFWMLVQLYKSSFGLPGETIEAGCLFGLSSFLMCHASRLRDPSFTGKGHHLVDSFRGFAEPHEADFGPRSHPIIHGLKNRPKVAGKGWRERTERTLAEFPDIAFHEGWIPEVFETLPETRYRFAHVDVDLHNPTRDCLEYFYPRLVETGILVIDDYGFSSWPGCKVATDAFAAEHGVPVVQLPTGNAFLIKRPPS
jgi:hypothetical protein